ncbi:response regulator [Marinibaculum pumilum]|uniref:histidine kinase n=1 Tax=Marinibaculum pumilum TaxID=1766165 RepID=A0ABV7L8E9_9PROT
MAAEQSGWLRDWTGRIRLGLAGRLTLAVLPVIAIAILAMAGLIGVFGDRLVDRLVTEQGRELSQGYLQELRHDINRRLDLVDGLARLVRGERASGAPSRRRIVEWMRDTSEGRPTQFGLWFVAEPDAIGSDRVYQGDAELGSGRNGRFQPYFIHDGSLARFAPLPADIAAEPRYRSARETGRPVVTPPYRAFVGGRERRLISIAVPVWNGGRLLGIAGTEFELGSPEAEVQRARPLGGLTTGVGPHGNWLYHPDPDRIGTPAVAGDPLIGLTPGQMAAIAAARSDISEVTVEGQEFRRFIMPFDVGLTGEQVVVVTDIPLQALNLPVHELRYGIAGIALVFCLLLFLVLMLLVRRTIGRPLRRLNAAVEALEEGRAPEPLRESQRLDEVGSIARAIDRLRLSLAAQRRLRRDLERMMGALEHAGDGVLLVDREGRVVYANPAMAQLSGLEPEALKPGTLHRSLTSPASIARRMAPGMPGAALAQGRDWQGVLEDWEGLGGRTVDAVALSMTILPQGDVLYVARDVSQQRRAARERDQMQAQLLHQDRLDALGRLTGGIAHEFNNLLGAVLGYAELLTADLDKGSAQHGFAARIEQTALRARDLVGRLVTFARDDMVEDVTFDLGSAVRDALSVLRVSVRAGIVVDLEIEDGALPVVGNEGQLVQMLMNLCLNARDAIEEARTGPAAGDGAAALGPGRIVIRVAPDRHWHARMLADGVAGWPQAMIGEPEAGRDYLVLSVRDNGSGIPEPEFGRIFDPFFTTKARGKGSGLGLATVFGILRSWHGHVRLRSALGEGAQFELCLPLAQQAARQLADGATAGAGKPAGTVPAPPAPALRHILLVDDEEDLVEATRDALQRLGHEVVVATDPLRALAMLQGKDGGRFDLLISDRNMPHMFGDELVRRARTLHPELSCILCTGHVDGQDQEALRSAGIEAIFRKPLRAAELASWIDSHPAAMHATAAG